MRSKVWHLGPATANLALEGCTVIGVPGATLATQTANGVTAAVKEAQMRTLVLDPVTARKMLKEETAAAANLAFSTCKRIITRDVMNVSVQGFPTDVKVPTGPMAMYKI